MCGIVGYVGTQEALPILLSGLEKLEYRGYDSAGVAVFANGAIQVGRAEGKLAALKDVLAKENKIEGGSLGIGHTRWATHGKPSETNAHPHSAGRVSLIHNGIIENYLELRKELEAEGKRFSSETDTEIAAHLLNRELEQGAEPFQALVNTCQRLRGSFAFLAIDAAHADRILVAKYATPLVIGLGDGETFIASDIPAVLDHTREVLILEDGDIAEVRADGVRIEHNSTPVERPVEHITWDPVTAQKSGFKHYMLKEIHEQVSVLAETFRGRVRLGRPGVWLEELHEAEEQFEDIDRIVIVACGTALYAGLVAKFYIESLANIPCEVDYASEFRYRKAVYTKSTLVLAISQSGETADTLAAIESVRDTCRTFAICNVLGSSITRRVEKTLYTHAGPEISVASTKAFSTQLVASFLFALYLGQRRNVLSEDDVLEHINTLFHLPTAVQEALEVDEQVQELAKELRGARDFLYLGRGMCYPIALEGALKLKEISYIHAEGYPAGEMKHGPIALIDENMPVVVVLQRSREMFDKTLSNLREVESRGGRIIAITDTSQHEELHSLAEKVIEVPFLSEVLSPVVLTLPLQLLAYHIADMNGTDVDLPRNLAKSVTVE